MKNEVKKGVMMDENVVAKVKECAMSYLGMQPGDSVSVAEVFNDEQAQTQGFDVQIQGKETPAPVKCFVVVKDGKASIVTQPTE
jgi:hypothetical protein